MRTNFKSIKIWNEGGRKEFFRIGKIGEIRNIGKVRNIRRMGISGKIVSIGEIGIREKIREY